MILFFLNLLILTKRLKGAIFTSFWLMFFVLTFLTKNSYSRNIDSESIKKRHLAAIEHLEKEDAKSQPQTQPQKEEASIKDSTVGKESSKSPNDSQNQVNPKQVSTNQNPELGDAKKVKAISGDVKSKVVKANNNEKTKDSLAVNQELQSRIDEMKRLEQNIANNILEKNTAKEGDVNLSTKDLIGNIQNKNIKTKEGDKGKSLNVKYSRKTSKVVPKDPIMQATEDYKSNIREYLDGLNPQEITKKSFVNKEPLPVLISSNVRDKENLHIPLVLKLQDLVNSIFPAIKNGDVASFNEIYRKINNPDIIGDDGETMLSTATIFRQHQMIKALLYKGANPDMANKLNYLPIEIAVMNDDPLALQILLEHGARFNYLDQDGNNIIAMAVYKNHFSAVRVLSDFFIRSNIKIAKKNKAGQDAVYIAKNRGSDDIAKFLIAKIEHQNNLHHNNKNK
jgi:hypothetical protein